MDTIRLGKKGIGLANMIPYLDKIDISAKIETTPFLYVYEYRKNTKKKYIFFDSPDQNIFTLEGNDIGFIIEQKKKRQYAKMNKGKLNLDTQKGVNIKKGVFKGKAKSVKIIAKEQIEAGRIQVNILNMLNFKSKKSIHEKPIKIERCYGSIAGSINNLPEIISAMLNSEGMTHKGNKLLQVENTKIISATNSLIKLESQLKYKNNLIGDLFGSPVGISLAVAYQIRFYSKLGVMHFEVELKEIGKIPSFLESIIFEIMKGKAKQQIPIPTQGYDVKLIKTRFNKLNDTSVRISLNVEATRKKSL